MKSREEFSTLRIEQIERVGVGLYAFDLELCARAKGVGGNQYFCTGPSNVLSFGGEFQEGVAFADGMESLVRQDGSVEVEVDSSAVADRGVARQACLLCDAEPDETFARAATW